MVDPLAAIVAEISKPNHGSEWISGLTGAGGAILGALVTVAWTEIFNRRTRSRNDRERRSVGGFAVYQKLNQIYSVSIIIRNHFREGISANREAGEPICSKLQPVNKLSDSVIFSMEELWAALKVGGAELLNGVNSLDQAFNSLIAVVEDYRKQRDALFEKLEPTTMSGVIGSLELDQAALRSLQPLFNSLDFLIPQIENMASTIVDQSFDSLERLVHAKTKPLGENFEISLPNPQGVTVKISANDAPRASIWSLLRSARSIRVK